MLRRWFHTSTIQQALERLKGHVQVGLWPRSDLAMKPDKLSPLVYQRTTGIANGEHAAGAENCRVGSEHRAQTNGGWAAGWFSGGIAECQQHVAGAGCCG